MNKQFNSPAFWLAALGGLIKVAQTYCPSLVIPNPDVQFAASLISWLFIACGAWSTHTLTWSMVLGWLGITTTGPTAEDKLADKVAQRVIAVLQAPKVISSAPTGERVLKQSTKTCDLAVEMNDAPDKLAMR